MRPKSASIPTRTLPRTPWPSSLATWRANSGGVENGACFGKEGRARLGEPHALWGALEQQDAEIPLESGDARGHGALHDVQAPRGPGEAPLAGDGGEVFQLPQFHERPSRHRPVIITIVDYGIGIIRLP